MAPSDNAHNSRNNTRNSVRERRRSQDNNVEGLHRMPTQGGQPGSHHGQPGSHHAPFSYPGDENEQHPNSGQFSQFNESQFQRRSQEGNTNSHLHSRGPGSQQHPDDSFDVDNTGKTKAEQATYWSQLISGVTVALAIIPEAVAFAFVAKVREINILINYEDDRVNQ
jgi:hypothetical protein